MAEVQSTFRLEPGATAPDFFLPDFEGTPHALTDLARGKQTVVIVFACNHCPFVVHLAKSVGEMAREYSGLGVPFIAINANDIGRYPADSPDRMGAFARTYQWDFPYLYDSTQTVAQAFAAACTPDFYLFDGDLKLAYAGQYDGTRPGKGGAPDGADLRRAIDALLTTGKGPDRPWQPSSGCSIKWKPGNAPNYF